MVGHTPPSTPTKKKPLFPLFSVHASPTKADKERNRLQRLKNLDPFAALRGKKRPGQTSASVVPPSGSQSHVLASFSVATEKPDSVEAGAADAPRPGRGGNRKREGGVAKANHTVVRTGAE